MANSALKMALILYLPNIATSFQAEFRTWDYYSINFIHKLTFHGLIPHIINWIFTTKIYSRATEYIVVFSQQDRPNNSYSVQF